MSNIDVKSLNYFEDNVTRSATMDVSKQQNDDKNVLSANMSLQLDVIGKTNVIHIYPVIVPWGNDTTNTIMLEDKNHVPIKIKSDCNYNCGTFQTILKTLPICVDEQGETIGDIRIGTIDLPNSNNIYDRIFAKYHLPDIYQKMNNITLNLSLHIM
jgi:hypothetical protein